MIRAKKTKIVYTVLTMILLGSLPWLGYCDQLVFLNRTASMPIGLYIKTGRNKVKIGDIIVFFFNETNRKLIKYIAAMEGDEVCLDFANTFWVNQFPVAQKNIEKYPERSVAQSVCQQLHLNEIFVVGEHPDSYDSRYFGPIKTTNIIAAVTLCWPL